MAYREIADDEGAIWAVWDTHPESARHAAVAAFAGGWLTFQSGAERRRLVPSPDGWVDASEERLRQWLASAAPVTFSLELSEDMPAPHGRVADQAPGDESLPRRSTRSAEEPATLIERSREILQEVMRALDRGSEPVVERRRDPEDDAGSRHRR
jgi:hypothetical protein